MQKSPSVSEDSDGFSYPIIALEQPFGEEEREPAVPPENQRGRRASRNTYLIPDDVSERIGVLLAEVREKRGLTQPKAAGMIGITSHQLRKYESGISACTIERLMQFARIYRVSLATLIPPEYIREAEATFPAFYDLIRKIERLTPKQRAKAIAQIQEFLDLSE